MSKYIFKKLKNKNNDYNKTEITMEIEEISLYDILEEFEYFLKASGFSIGKLEHITEEQLKELEFEGAE